jgi:hypothetical protein
VTRDRQLARISPTHESSGVTKADETRGTSDGDGVKKSCRRVITSKTLLYLLVGCCYSPLFVTVSYAAQWPEAKRQAITEYMQQYRRDWTRQDTDLLAQGQVPPHAEADVFINNRPSNLRIRADDGRVIPLEVLGESLLVNGKDISGNLGSKTTHGANSPIIEDVSGSQISTGNNSPITGRSNYTINISLSIALSVSLALNLYFLKKIRQRRTTARKTGAARAG